MLSKMIVSSYKALIEISLWLSMILFLSIGWGAASNFDTNGVFGAIGGLVVWFVIAVIFFGAFLVLSDIRQAVRSIEKTTKS